MAKSERSKSIKHSAGIDRISSLPEPLLSRILSLLPTKHAVATSLLSTRWKFLWTSITNLEFDNKETLVRCPKASRDMKKMKFTLFVNRVLLLLSPPCVQNFRLSCHHKLCDPLYLDSWICAAMGRTVQKLELNLEMARSMELPLRHFHCKTLSVLKLDGNIHFKIAEVASNISFRNLLTLHLSNIEFTIASSCSVTFPSLKDLVLNCVRYTNEESVHKLFASCYVLESLIIRRSDRDNAPNLVISVPSLISLTIRFWPFESSWQFRLHIDTPSLEYLDVVDESKCCFTSENLSSLLKANIGTFFSGLLTVDDNSYCNNILNFIGGLCNVKALSLSGDTLEVFLSMSANISPAFRNLTRLKLGADSCSCWSVVLANLLGSMDNLEHLAFNVSEDPCDSETWWMEPSRVPLCLLHRVATISFNRLVCSCSNEVELVMYLMKNAKVLKKLTIDMILGTEAENFNFMQKLLMNPRGSPECLVHVGGTGVASCAPDFWEYFWEDFWE